MGTRCCAPLVPDLVVRRSRLEDLLADGERRRVTLVAGPPGSGKTTLLACCFGTGEDSRATWLTVDGYDDTRTRFAELVVEALGRSGAVAGPVDPAWSGEAMLDAAFEQLMARDDGRVLVVDDVHELRSPANLRALAYLVERAPETLHVVVSTRADPPIRWERLELAGRLRQVRWADLAFSRPEAAELVAAHGVRLDDEGVETLWRHTEGWAAGLRLAVGALEAEAEPGHVLVGAAVTETAVAEYLLVEVLDRQEAEVQDFLLQTSVAERLTRELAVALTGHPRAGPMLADLSRRGLFLTGLEDSQSYRYHALFRSLLEAHLQQRQPGMAESLHRRAALWHLVEGTTREAESHARAAGDWDLVGRLVLERWLAEIVGDTEPWPPDPLAGIPTDAIAVTPELAMVAATEACRWGRREEADLYREVWPDAAPPSSAAGDGRTWDAARLLGDVTYGWSFGTDHRSHAAVAMLRNLTSTDTSTLRFRQLAVLAQAEQDIGAGELDLARQRLEELADQRGPGWHENLATAFLALVEASSGALWAAQEHLGRTLTELDGRRTAPAAEFVRLAETLCAAQKGGQHAVVAAPASEPAVPEWSSRSLRCVERAVRAAANGTAPFFVSLDEATARHPLAERALLALGVLEAVDHRGRSILVGGKGERVVLDARRHLAEGAPERADGLLTDWLDHPAERHPRTAVEAAALAAVAAEGRGDGAAAGRRLRSALDLAAATGIMAPLLALGSHLRSPVEQHVDDLGPAAPVALELLDRFRQPGAAGLVEELTDRELEVLRRLPTLMSNAEIGEALYLSVNTVKTHLKALYRKLGVHTRREAVQRGRELELV